MGNSSLHNTGGALANADLPQVFNDREAWLHEAADMLLDDVILNQTTRPKPVIRVSCGFPRGSRGGKTLGVCHAKSVSGDGVNEIFISPILQEPFAVMEVLAHELIHAILDCEGGHRGAFGRIARAIGLEGPLTATHAGEDLLHEIVAVIAVLGQYPHAAMKPRKAKANATRQLKCQCSQCELIVRMSRAAINQVLKANGYDGCCPACNTNSLVLDV